MRLREKLCTTGDKEGLNTRQGHLIMAFKEEEGLGSGRGQDGKRIVRGGGHEVCRGIEDGHINVRILGQ